MDSTAVNTSPPGSWEPGIYTRAGRLSSQAFANPLGPEAAPSSSCACVQTGGSLEAAKDKLAGDVFFFFRKILF